MLEPGEELERLGREQWEKRQTGNEPPQVPQLDCRPWWRDPTKIPPRSFLYGKHYQRRYIGASIGAGGRLKTSKGLFEGVEMATGCNLTTADLLPGGELRVGYLSGEEDQDELDRRLAAICQHYNVTEQDLGGRLFALSVRDKPLRFATLVQNTGKLNQAALEALRNFIKQNQLDVWMVDPWVSFHSVRENDNSDMDLLLKEGLGGIAKDTNSAGEIFHHPGKPKQGQPDTTVEDARGASSIIAAVRSARVFNFMTSEDAAKLGVAEIDRRGFVRVSNGKANMGPTGTADWLKIEVENLPNGDEVACATLWKPPNPFEDVSIHDAERAAKVAQAGIFRADVQSPQWFGWELAKLLGNPIRYGGDNEPKDLAKIKSIIKTWITNGILKTVERPDEGRKSRKYILAGPASSFHKYKPADELDDEIQL